MLGETNDTKTQSFDLRVIELSKSSPANTLKEKLEKSDANGYVCLGHFDYLKVTPLLGDNPLASIETDFQGRDNYNYPLYIFHYPLKDQTLLDNFWTIRSCFMTVSRIHFIPNAQNKVLQLQEALKRLHQGATLTGKQPGELSICILGELVHIVFYHTLELSDLVVVLKSNSITSCLETIRRMMEVAQVGDVYSFCGVHSKLCRPEIDKAITAWESETVGEEQSCFKMSIKEGMEQKIPHASMRFSVISTQNAKKIWKQIGCNPYFISGTADAFIDFTGVSVKKLVESVAYLAIRTFDVGKGRRISMYDAFADIITRIGGEYGATYEGALPLGKKELTSALENAQKSLKGAVSTISEKNTRWSSILVAQTDTLTTMMGNCITDDLSILIWPSVQALITRLSYLLKNKYLIGQQQEAEIGEFLNSWDILENDISRLEGQLSQKPELLSSRYYVPATLLAFYMALLSKCNELLLIINQDKDCGYISLITYNVEPRASTRCILDPSTDKPNVVYDKETPLLVSLPVSMLYRPMETVIVLCHELSHYTGTFTRFREIRYKRILASCAELIAKEWMLDGRLEVPLIQNGGEKILNALVKKMDQLYPKPDPEHVHYYIAELNQNLFDVLIRTFYDEEFHSELMQRYLNAKAVHRCVLQYTKSIDARKQYQQLCYIRNKVKNLLILYRECYADLMAILVLNLSAEEYLLNMFYRETQYINEMSSGGTATRLQELQIQAALVLQVLGKSFTNLPSNDSSFSNEQADWIEHWKNEINRYQGVFERDQDIMNQDQSGTIMLQGEYANLLAYLEDCKVAVEERLKQPEVQKKQDELIHMLKTVKTGFDLEKIHKEITVYRNTLLSTAS